MREDDGMDGFAEMNAYGEDEQWATEDWGEEGDRDNENEELPCPSCGASVYEETQQCPHCGDWITPLAGSGTPVWARVVGLVVVFGLLFGVIVGLVRMLS